MINIKHLYTTTVEISYLSRYLDQCLKETRVGEDMDEIAEHCCEVVVKHNFLSAFVTSAETGEILMEVERPDSPIADW